MEPISEFEVTYLEHGIFKIMAPPMRFHQYLVLGEGKALLIDSGFGMGSLKAVVDKLTDLPIVLINTHGHPDHGGGNAEFGRPLLHPADNELYAQKCAYGSRLEEAKHWNIPDAAEQLQPTPEPPIPIEDGAEIELGGRRLTVIHTPGHTKGSISIFDEKTGYLFTGDNTMGNVTSLTEPSAATVSDYLRSMEKLLKLPAKAICTGHVPAVVEPKIMQDKLDCAKRILSGDMPETVHTPMGDALRMEVNGTAVHYRPDNVT